MSEVRQETMTDEEIAKDPSRHPNQREAARGRLIDKDNARRAEYDARDRGLARDRGERFQAPPPARDDDRRPLQNPPGFANTPGNG